ncbi:MAG: hypothetical protein PWP10_3334 [Clostridiales bacterium]|nr:hypothetical protein [Clostridiales bacterium]
MKQSGHGRMPNTIEHNNSIRAGRVDPRRAKKRNNRSRQYSSQRQGGRVPLLILMTVLLIFAGMLISQLYQLQIVEYEVNAQKAASQHFTKVTEQPERGRIYDRNGVELAGTTYVYRIGVTPADVRSITKNITKEEIAEGIALALNLEVEQVEQELAQVDATYIQLKKDVPRQEADALKEFLSSQDIGGVRIDSEPRRYYTNGSLASQVIGFANYNNGNLTGQLGVELQYNNLLTGQPGYTYVETDNYGSRGELPFSVPTTLGAKDGLDLHLNIDINIQKIIQEELERAILQYDITSGGSVVALDPYTGAVLGMASYPYFDSSQPVVVPEGTRLDAMSGVNLDVSGGASEETIEFLSSQIWRNRAISDTYEPGSTMKAVTTAISLDENITNESELFDDSPMRVLDWTISCSSRVGHGIETLEQGFWRSCNPVFAQLALRTGVDKFYSYMKAFGFTTVTGIDLPAEGVGILHENPTELDMATFSYGESSTLTPIQVASAFCTFANGGNLMQPSLLKSVTDSEGAVINEVKPETVRRVISEQTSARVRELLKGVVLYGTGSQAYVEGYAVAGKTSTATDDFGDHTISFAALAPADNPEIVVLVVMQKPRDKSLTSSGAARTAGQIVGRTLEYLGVAREYSELDISRLSETKAVPDVNGMTYAEAMKLLGNNGLRAEAGERSMSDQTIIKSQWPQAGSSVHHRSLIYLYPAAEIEEDLVVVPDLTGKTVHESLLSANEAGLNILIEGDCLGIVKSQTPGSTHGETTDQETETDNEANNNVVDNGSESTPGNDETDGSGEEIDPETGNPIKNSTNRLQRGSQIILRFEQIEEHLDDILTGDEHDASETQSSDAAE